MFTGLLGCPAYWTIAGDPLMHRLGESSFMTRASDNSSGASQRAGRFDLRALCIAIAVIAMLCALPRWVDPEIASTVCRSLLGAIFGRATWGTKGLFLGAVTAASFPFVIEARLGCIVEQRFAWLEATTAAFVGGLYWCLLRGLSLLGIQGWR